MLAKLIMNKKQITFFGILILVKESSISLMYTQPLSDLSQFISEVCLELKNFLKEEVQ